MPTRRPRRKLAYVGALGISLLHLRNPWVVAWWSVALPGFGHLLLSKYFRGTALILWEFIVNTNAHLNTAILYTFSGRFDLARHALDLRWLMLYPPVFLFAVYDSYRSTVDMNAISALADRERADIRNFTAETVEINYLGQKNPLTAMIWSFLTPGLGQLYVDRIVSAYYNLALWLVICYKSHVLQSIHLTLLGNFAGAAGVLDGQWFLFIPSVYFYGAYDAYSHAVEHNKLFRKEQASYLKGNYQSGIRLVSEIGLSAKGNSG